METRLTQCYAIWIRTSTLPEIEIQTMSASPFRTQVQPAASLLFALWFSLSIRERGIPLFFLVGVVCFAPIIIDILPL